MGFPKTLYDHLGIPCTELRNVPTKEGGVVPVSRHGLRKLAMHHPEFQKYQWENLPIWFRYPEYEEVHFWCSVEAATTLLFGEIDDSPKIQREVQRIKDRFLTKDGWLISKPMRPRFNRKKYRMGMVAYREK